MSDEEGAPPFPGDDRARYVGRKVCGLLGLEAGAWEASAAEPGTRATLADFFERGTAVFFRLSPRGSLSASDEVLPDVQNKEVYILKKRAVPLSTENCKEVLLFGLLSPSALQQLSSTIEQLCLPLLSNENNRRQWPSVMSEDLLQHVERMRSRAAVVQGQVLGETVLPMQTAPAQMENAHSTMTPYDHYDSAVVHGVESMVISWSTLVQRILKEDSAELLLKGSNPGPSVEIDFWASRRRNLTSVHHQLQSPAVWKMVKILEMSESSYEPTFKTLIGNVFDALQEARDIDVHLRPLQFQLSRLEEDEFPQTEPLLPALFHTLGLIWTHCASYRRPARIVVLLQEVCNLHVQQASDYLCGDQLLKEDTDEGLQRVKKAARVLARIRRTYDAQRERLSGLRAGAPWDFPSAMVFTRFDRFLRRVRQIQDLFEMMLDFQRLEKLEFGGLRGKIYSEQAARIYGEFTDLCQAVKQREYNPLDSQDFEKLYQAFKVKISDFECRLATLLCLAFKDCSGLESAFKLLAVFRPFLERKQIMQIFSPNFLVLRRHFGEELERCKHLLKHQEAGLVKNMAHTSGALKWTKMLRERIQTPWQNFKLLFDKIMEGAEVVREYQMSIEMLALLDQHEEQVYSEWCNGLDRVCSLNLNQPLITRNISSGLISVNFNSQLMEVLRDVKYIQTLNRADIPAVATALFQKREVFVKYVSALQLLARCYNALKLTVLEVELPLIRVELADIDLRLNRAEVDLTWEDRSCWSFIRTTRDLVHDLGCRVQRAKNNCEVIQSLMKGWSRQPMFCRKDNKRGTLIPLEDRADRANRKYSFILRDGETIHKLVQENMALTHADPTSEAWRSYLEYMDEIVVDGLFKYINHSLRFFVENTEPGPSQAPLFEADLLLEGTLLTFSPSLRQGAGDGLYELVEGLIGDIFKASAKVNRVAAHLNKDSYQDVMADVIALLDLRQEIMWRVEKVLKQALDYQRTLGGYAHLWLEDRAEFLRQFLLFGHVLTSEEVDTYVEDVLPENPPTIDIFKEQIDYYEGLYTQVSKLEDLRVFDGWFQVSIKPFKISLLNVIKKWSWLFKGHLMTNVVDSLDDLEEFVRATAHGLTQPVSEGDPLSLTTLMSHLAAIRDRQKATDQMFQPLRDTITLLERYGETFPEQVYAQLEELPEKWSAAKKLALSVRHEVAPMQNAEVLVLRRRCMQLEEKQNTFREKFKTDAPFSYRAVHPYNSLEKYEKEIRKYERKVVELQELTNLFDVTVPDYREIKLCRREIVVLKNLWDIVVYVQSSVENWTDTKWRRINVDQMDADLRSFAKDMQKLDKEARTWDVYCGLDLYVKNLLTSLRAVRELQRVAIRDRHWVQLVRTMKMDFTVSDSSTLEDLLALQLHLFEEEVCDIVDKAVKEMAIEKVITEISKTWATMEFSYGDRQTSVPLLKCDEHLIETLEDHQVQLQGICQSKHVDHFVSQVSRLQKQLTVADSVLMVWMEVQRTWAHLESIFIGCDDIGHQLPADTHRFQTINTDFQELMMDSAKTRNVIKATNKPHLHEKLEDLQKRLALCEKALAEYLETKRLTFPRFYFVSSSDLLDILSKGSRPGEITRHLPKLFDNMSDLEFSKDEQDDSEKVAVGMYSKDGEYVPFHARCSCDGPVELWLTCLESTMRECVRRHLSEVLCANEDRSREQWVLDFPAQVALTGSQIWWSNDMDLVFQRLEEGFESALKDYNKKLVTQLNSLIGMLLGELSLGERQKIMTLCTIDVHARDVVANLIAQKVTNSQAFQWLSQLRHSWDERQRHCFVDICDARFLYSYEYLGNTPRLVVTPLTDRCYITLTQSLHLMMSGAPAGPAGTGKTETTKDLGRALGVMVYVFNCSEQMDYKSIGNIYKGLAQTGAWGCFDEFNRIAVDVLSVVAVQVKTIQDAIRNKKKRFLFLDEDIPLQPSVGIFITMNPGYAGRTALPENLKALFRPCAMVVPDIELICEIMLVAEGFLSAKPLARKFITLYMLCKELLSKQEHYDWGLRAIKSVLVVAGALRRGDKSRPEDQVLMRALRDFNTPKIVTEDVSVFSGLLGDLFPGVEVERKRDLAFEQEIRRTTAELRLQPEEPFILKVVQLEELLAVRHSVFVVGNAGTGKSQILRVLNKTYSNLKRRPVWSDLNTKVVDTDELFGFIHPGTREWRDGLLSSLMREQAKISHPGPKWIVLDGDIDPMWIESLNTVMDDNKVLTLANNERVPLSSSMRLVFEISHLRMATPATVSRAGVLYVNSQDLGWSPYVASWIDTRARQTERAHLTILFDKYVPPCLEHMRNSFRTITPIPENTLVQTLCALLDCLLTPENIPSDSPRELYETYFTFACIWAFGGALHQDQLHDYRVEFSRWWTKEMKTVKLPAQGTVFDFYLDPLTRRFLPWSDAVPPLDFYPDAPLQAVLAHTAETVRLRYLVDLLLERGHPVMLVGNAGVGKTALVRNKLDSLPKGYVTAKVPFNYYTTSYTLQTALERLLEKRAGRTYSPVGNRRLICFIDDINMPAVDGYGSVQPHALIRQHLDYKHWYDRQKLFLKEVTNTQYVACMNPTAGSFTINPRLQRHFSVFAVNFPSPEAQLSIYSQVLGGHMRQHLFSPAVQRVAPAVVQAAVALHHKVVLHFLPTAVRFHYIFNLRDLSNIFQGLLLAAPESVRESADLVRLWLHESCRVYGDRMVDAKDVQLFHKLQMETVHKCFQGVDDREATRQPLLYCHFARGGEESCYASVRDWDEIRTVLSDALESYNELNAVMNLVLFDDAMQHVCRISRILVSPRGHGLLVGVGGSGKQSLTRLAAYVSSMEVLQITAHSVQDLKVELAGLFVKTGVKRQRVALLLTDAQILDERLLVLINDLLASGEIPDLFSEEEIEGIVASVRTEVRANGELDNRDNCWRFFIDRVRLQLKVVLCLSPVGGALQVRARRFPALVHCTTIDWFHGWSAEALQSVSYRFLKEIEGIEPAVRESISLFMAYVHTGVNKASEKYRRDEKRYNYTTPKSFLQHIALYGSLLGKSRSQLRYKMNRLESGLQKIQTTAAQVQDLKAKLASQEAELTVKNRSAEALISKIGLQTEKVRVKREAADADARKVAVIQTEVSTTQRDSESDLAKAEPALAAATAALNTLNKVNLTELKTFPNPPVAVINVAAAVMVLLAPRGRVPKERSWKAARAFMGKVDDFLQTLVSYDKEHIPEACLSVVKQQYLKNPEFHPDLVRTKSTAAAGLCAWIINIVRYYEVYCEVAPKREALKQANGDLDTATSKLSAVQKKLDDLDANLRSLMAQFERATAEKVSCQEEVSRTDQTIELANRLVKGLESERQRWSQAVVRFAEQQKTLCGDVLLASAFVSYLGYFSRKYRLELFYDAWIPFLRSQKVSVPLTESLDPVLLLTDDATVAAWHNQGLPNDRMSVENAAILNASERWPLVIDPQRQGIEWIRTWCGSELRVVQLGQKGYLDVIEEALAGGGTVLIENVTEKVDPVLEPLLGKNTVKKGRCIRIGGKECEYDRGFRLILHTKLTNPHFPPELQAQTTLINFTVTPEGLEEQLLGQVVTRERLDLENLKLELTTQQNHFKIELKSLEDELLNRLSAAQGNFLNDISLVERLESTKTAAAHVHYKVVEAREAETKINEARELYRPAAERASLLYFIINYLSRISPMYQFSLKAFNRVFQKAMSRATRDEDVAARVRNLTEAVTYSVFLYTSQGLFERDKLTFLSHTSFQILLKRGVIDAREFDFLLRFPVVQSKVSPVSFLSPQAWGAIKAISSMEQFGGLDRDIESAPKRWRKVVESKCPEKERFPQDWKSRSSFQKLLILRAIRPDRMIYTLRSFVEESMGSRYVEAAGLELEKSFEDSDPATPVFFILSPGVDPLKHVEKLGLRLGFSIEGGTLHNVSLGQGQEEVAERVMRSASELGHWVFLQNVHLVARWLPSLEALLEAAGAHPAYRVFISGEPALTAEQRIPRGILESAVKIANEPPAGMNASLHAALHNFSQDTLEMCSREQEFNSLFFSLCYFHACVTERRKFGPQGWNQNYPFNNGDLTISVNILYNYLEATSKVPWEDLCYLFGEIMYGGHITDDWDRRLCQTYLREYMHPKMFEGELFLCPGFPAPPFADYGGYHAYVDERLPPESPSLYGLHPNAELDVLTVASDGLFRTLLRLQPQNPSGGDGASGGTEEQVKVLLDDLLEKLPEDYNIVEIMSKRAERSPYSAVCFQECERMNVLLAEIRRSLEELDLGLKGELTASSGMEALQSALFRDSVPESWARLASPSTKTLALWFIDLMCSCRELDSWTQDLVLPAVVWLPGLFNPQSFLTAVMQSIARKNQWPLDDVALTVDVTKKTREDYGHPPREGAYIHGLFMEGARWDTQSGTISDAVLRELSAAMPVLYVRASPAEQRDLSSTYRCPLYRTRRRGPDYVWTFHLRTRQPPARWVIGGVALLLSA